MKSSRFILISLFLLQTSSANALILTKLEKIICGMFAVGISATSGATFYLVNRFLKSHKPMVEEYQKFLK